MAKPKGILSNRRQSERSNSSCTFSILIVQMPFNKDTVYTIVRNAASFWPLDFATVSGQFTAIRNGRVKDSCTASEQIDIC
ncbi:hypothetical protein PanWU01x14_287880 [Parasponia andersonii]|uniref:Uncharacterized protein n=1 Tax=Parasponia andersonii TaxID=3476 RepID=A0A2P5AYI5_PARAD|nr:hypothetical protein PanWU01x14_287880 [Parasponia andersonii]